MKAHGLVEREGSVVCTTDDQGKSLESAFGQLPQAVGQEPSTNALTLVFRQHGHLLANVPVGGPPQ